MCRRAPGLLLALVACWVLAPHAAAQNDWQFPDPYFGILEIEKDLPPRPRVQRSEGQSKPFAPAARGQRYRVFRPRSKAPARTHRP